MGKKTTESVKARSRHPEDTYQTMHQRHNGLVENMNFDDTAKQMAALKALIFNTSETTPTKIQFIKEELSADRYQIQYHQIAAKLLEYTPLREEAEMA